VNDDIDEADFEAILNIASPGGFRDMVHDIYEQWQEGRELSERQIEVIQTAAARARWGR